jgi:hypothetical protein
MLVNLLARIAPAQSCRVVCSCWRWCRVHVFQLAAAHCIIAACTTPVETKNSCQQSYLGVVLQVLALVPRADVAARALFARWLVAFCRASKWYIREDEPLEEELRGWLEPSELQQLVRPLLLLVLTLFVCLLRGVAVCRWLGHTLLP